LADITAVLEAKEEFNSESEFKVMTGETLKNEETTQGANVDFV